MATDSYDEAPNPGPDAGTDSLRRFARFTPEDIGRSVAFVHGQFEWKETGDYVAERLSMLNQANERLQEIVDHYHGHDSASLLQRELTEAQAALTADLPSELPFLSVNCRVQLRLRIAVVVREWLLSSHPTNCVDDLKTFLAAYQKLSPLCLQEIRLIPTALRLAVAEKCHILPTPGQTAHLELIPRLIENLTRVCHIIYQTDWTRFGEDIGSIHALLEKDR